MENDQQFHTTDLDQVAFLLYKGFDAQAERDGGITKFTFDATPELDAALLAYVDGSAMVSAIEFAAVRRRLLAAIKTSLPPRLHGYRS